MSEVATVTESGQAGFAEGSFTWEDAKKLLKPIASLRLTVVLFCLSLVLIFAGTLAQRDQGIWTVLNDYFRTWWVNDQGRPGFPLSNLDPTGLTHGFSTNVIIPFPGGYPLGGLMLINLLAAHLTRFKFSWKRAGIIMIHVGVILILVGELVTALYQVEGNMIIDEGGSSNFLQSTIKHELAVIDRSDPNEDYVVAVPQSMLQNALKNKLLIDHKELPFRIQVLEYYSNSDLVQKKAGETTPATNGDGLQWKALPLDESTDSSVDHASAYITLVEKDSDRELGRYLVSQWLDYTERPQKVTVDDKDYDVYLRFQRDYKPYTIHLVDFKHDKYMGTETARNFSSEVRLTDPSRDVVIEENIYMNHPLRYEGETFYQSSFKPDDSGTILQVVRNPGWQLPYIACVMVSSGMLVHFVFVLFNFLVRTSGFGGYSLVGNGGSNILVTIGIVLGCVALTLGSWNGMTPKYKGDMDLEGFGQLPVIYNGRVKPIDTLARNSLMIVSGRQTFKDKDGKRHSAVEWFLDVVAVPSESYEHQVFKIENEEVLSMLGLPKRSGFRYAISEFADGEVLEKMDKLANDARRKPADKRTLVEGKIVEFANKLMHYKIIETAFKVPDIRNREALMREIESFRMVMRSNPPLAIPAFGSEEDQQWQPLIQAYIESSLLEATGKEPNPAVRPWSRIVAAYSLREAKVFNDSVKDYRTLLEEKKIELPDSNKVLNLNRQAIEVGFNLLEPFYLCQVLYVTAFLLTLLGWCGLGWSAGGAFWLLVFTLVIHTVALGTRIYLQGRPPVTNLYSSAIFIGWGGTFIALVAEAMFRYGFGNAMASVIGFLTLIIAHFLSLDGDTMEMMQAVLDTNFWLATHVTAITLGYSATFAAGALGIFYIGLSFFESKINKNVFKVLSLTIYGIVCLAVLLSFTGTVLGGIWADQSWGRFWGWDPKENGALMIVVWNALILHARWGGLVRQQGVAVLAVLGNVVTAWSWFGVNMMGVGLHSYGFMASAMMWLLIFAGSQVLIAGFGAGRTVFTNLWKPRIENHASGI